MPERIATAAIRTLDPEVLESDDAYPGAYGFHVLLSCDPGPEWAAEFEAVYNAGVYPGKPPLVFRGDTLCVFYLPRYAGYLPSYLNFLQAMVAETNRAVEKRNAALPNEEKEKELLRQKLRALVSDLKMRVS